MISIAAALVAAQFMTSLNQKTIQAFDTYFLDVDAAMTARAASPNPFAGRGQGVTAHAKGRDAGSGMLHDWSAVSFLPGAKKAKAIAVLQNFSQHPSIYPEVIAGRLERTDGTTRYAFHRLRKKKVLEVTLEVKYKIDLLPGPPSRYATRSTSAEIVEIQDAGTPKERRLPPGQDHGFLWRLNTYWILDETPEGLWMECRSVSLTRDTPFGLGWAVNPIVRDLPKESLEALMNATRNAVLRNN